MSSSESAITTLDRELAMATEASLTLGQHEVTTARTAFATPIRWPRQNYARLYKVSTKSESDIASFTTHSNVGVPGFPDFPDCWQGVEGGGRGGCPNTGSSRSSATHDYNKKGSLFRTTTKTKGVFLNKRRWRRKAVNRHAVLLRKRQKNKNVKRNNHHPHQSIGLLSRQMANLTCRTTTVTTK